MLSDTCSTSLAAETGGERHRGAEIGKGERGSAAGLGSVLYAEQFFYPEGWAGAQIPQAIARRLALSGYKMSVLCGSDLYSPVEGSPGRDPVLDGVRVIRVPRLLGGELHSLKFLRQLWFYICALPVLMFVRKPDLIVAQTNPPLLVVIAALAARARRVHFVIIAQDIYPEVMIAHGMLPEAGIAARLLRVVFRWAYASAQRVVSLGPMMTGRLLEKGVAEARITEISNWATGDESAVRGGGNVLRDPWGLAGKFVVLYSGNIGVAHEVRTIVLGAAKASAACPELRLVFVGKGSRLGEARELVKVHGLERVVAFHPPVPTDLLPHSIGLADLAVVTLRDRFEGLVVPSKLLGYMARGVPTLYVGPTSDASILLRKSDGGVAVAAGDVETCAAVLCSLAADRAKLTQMGNCAASYYATFLSREEGLSRYVKAINSL